MMLRRGLMMMAGGGKIPTFMNHLESGSFTLESGTYINIPLSNIDIPKGVLIYSNAFDLDMAKTDKTMLGAYAAMYIAGNNTLVLSGDNVYYLHRFTMYAVNWGQNLDNSNPTWRSSRAESRGIRWFKPSNRTIALSGFGTGEYDFKNNVEYHWIAWD